MNRDQPPMEEALTSESRAWLRTALLLVWVLLAGCAAVEGDAVHVTPAPVADPLLDIAEREGSVVVIVQLLVPQGAAGSYDATRIAKAQRGLMSDLGPGARVVGRFGRKVPQIMIRVDAEALTELRQSPKVVNISLNQTEQPPE